MAKVTSTTETPAQRAPRLSTLLAQLDDAVGLVEVRGEELNKAATAHEQAQTAFDAAHKSASDLRAQMQTEIGSILPPSRVRVSAE